MQRDYECSSDYYLAQRVAKPLDYMNRGICKCLERESSIPELATIVALHLHAVLGDVKIVINAGEVFLQLGTS